MAEQINNILAELKLIQTKLPELRDLFWLKIDRYSEIDQQRGIVFDEKFEQQRNRLKSNDAVIPDYIVSQHRDDLIDGEKWGVIKLIYIPPVGKEKGYVELADYKPFRPYKVDLQYFRDCRKQFTTEEWIDVLLSAMEYNPNSFSGTTQKLEFLTRLLIFVEPRLNMIELAPKGIGKSYVFGNLSKYGWLISGGKVSLKSYLEAGNATVDNYKIHA